jgi:hypothetical protein
MTRLNSPGRAPVHYVRDILKFVAPGLTGPVGSLLEQAFEPINLSKPSSNRREAHERK